MLCRYNGEKSQIYDDAAQSLKEFEADLAQTGNSLSLSLSLSLYLSLSPCGARAATTLLGGSVAFCHCFGACAISGST